MSQRLTYKQQLFIDYYEGNGTDACRLAGYSGSDNVLAQQSRHLLRNPQIASAIQNRYLEAHSGDIADRETRQEFWTSVMMSQDEPVQIRLKASEILGKSCGDFITKVEHASVQTIQEILDEISGDDEPLVKE